MNKSILGASFLLTLASLLFLFTNKLHLLSPDQLILPTLVLWILLFLISLPARKVIGDRDWTSIFLVVIVLGFFSSTIFAYTYSLIILLVLLCLWGALKILKIKLKFGHVFLLLNLTSFVVIVLSSINFVQQFRSIPAAYFAKTVEVADPGNSIDLDRDSSTKPDIYFIVLDGYGRADILRALYGFDNSEFIRNLEQKGFIVSANSRSNYPKTVLSVSSALNMEYVSTFAPGLDSSTMWWLMTPWIDHSRVRNSLEKIGYSSVSINSGWSITDNPTTDYYLKSHPVILSDFDQFILGVTPLSSVRPVIASLATVPTYDTHRRIELNHFSSLVESTAIPGPKFVFAHIILPHPPFVFSEDGAAINPAYSFTFNDASDFPGTSRQYRDRYIGQMQFLNGRLETVIETILQSSKTPPIILLLADHGPGMLTDFASAATTCLAERFSTFSAFYLPGKDRPIIPEDITPVNLFRIIFNEYFHADLPILENAYYYPRSPLAVYDLEDVTDRIDDGENCGFK